MTPSPGDTLITLRTIGPLRRGDVVAVASTCADGEYVYLDGYERQAFRADAFLVAVRRPWWAWAEPGWAAQARAAAEGFVREGIAVGAGGATEQAARVADHWAAQYPPDVFCGDGPEGRVGRFARHVATKIAEDIRALHASMRPSPSPAATEAEIRAKAFEFIAQRLEAKARAADLGATFWHGSLHGTSIYNFFTYAADEVRSLAAKETER